jgi:hypothetical protein
MTERSPPGWSIGVNHATRSAIRYINRFGRLNVPLHDRWPNEPAASGGAGSLLYLKYVVGNQLSGVHPPMPKKPPHGTELLAGRPLATMHGDTGSVTINLREGDEGRAVRRQPRPEADHRRVAQGP